MDCRFSQVVLIATLLLSIASSQIINISSRPLLSLQPRLPAGLKAFGQSGSFRSNRPGAPSLTFRGSFPAAPQPLGQPGSQGILPQSFAQAQPQRSTLPVSPQFNQNRPSASGSQAAPSAGPEGRPPVAPSRFSQSTPPGSSFPVAPQRARQSGLSGSNLPVAPQQFSQGGASRSGFPVSPSAQRYQGNDGQAYTLRSYRDDRGYGGYSFGYETSNGIRQDERGEIRNAGRDDEASAVEGAYSYTGPDGNQYSVKYTADENGFVPEGDHIPPAASVRKKPLGIPSAAIGSLAGGGLG